MEEDKSLSFSSYASSRMVSRGLTEYHVWYCRFHCNKKYEVKGDTVWECKLPDGRNIKVRVRDTSTNLVVIDAFTYS